MFLLKREAATGGLLLKSIQACNFIKTRLQTQVFSCEICEIFKNTYFEEHLRTAASVNFLSDFFMSLKAAPYICYSQVLNASFLTLLK